MKQRGAIIVCAALLLALEATGKPSQDGTEDDDDYVVPTDEIQMTPATPEAPVIPDDEEDYSSLLDFGNSMKQFYDKEQHTQKNWRAGLKVDETLIHMFDKAEMTDCVFVVGADGQTESIKAHSVVLAAASPVFHYALRNATKFRVADWQPREFRKLLRYIYSGGILFVDFDESCELLKLASSLKVEGAIEVARKYLYLTMYPSRLWEAFRCAMDANEERLVGYIKEIFSNRTIYALKDPKLSLLSQDELAMLLERDDLNVDSEVELFEGALRWGYQQAVNDGLKPTPQLMREKLHPKIIKTIRFLTMTKQEFSQIHPSSGILDYQEGLAVMLNTPGGLPMPASLSSSTTKRNLNRNVTEPGTFETIDFSKIQWGSAWMRKFNDYFATTEIRNKYDWRLFGIQIPKSVQAKRNADLKEHFDIRILDHKGVLKSSFTYNKIPPATTQRFTYSNKTRRFEDNGYDNELINVIFDEAVVIPGSMKPSERYVIKIKFHDEREYPRWINTADVFLNEYTKHSVPKQSVGSVKNDYYSPTCDLMFVNSKEFIHSFIIE